MTQFPNSPSVGDQVTFSNATYEWDGSRWKSLGTIAVGPTGSTGAAGSQGVTGQTGAAGSAGSQGVTGQTGAAGSQGIQGVTGQTGAAGSQGIQGVTGNTGDDGTSVGYTAGNTAPSGSATGDFWYENDTGLYYANVFDGSTLAWLQVSGRPGNTGVTGDAGSQGIQGVTGNTGADSTVVGPTGPAGPAGAGSGGSTLSSGAGLTLTSNVAGVGYTMSVDFNGAATNQVLYHDGTGFSGDNSVLFAQDANHPHLEADIEGKLLKAIKADEALATLDPVYITGNVGASDRVTVGKADASDPTKMPAAGIVTGAFSTNDEGYMVVAGLVQNANTDGFDANDTAYVGVGGGITAARPSGATDLIQNLGRVGRVHASTGTLLVLGAGRANDTPNLIHARAGISCDGGITAAGIIAASSYHNILSPNTRLHFPSADQIQAIAQGVAVQRWDYNATYISGGTKLQLNSGVNLWVYNGTSTLGGLVNTQAGISMDAAGITFADGTYQASAASGSTITAGAGMTLAGSTLGIDPTAIVHVAGISSDGGITAGGDLNYTGILNAYDGGQIKLRQSGANRLVIQDSTLATLYTTRFHIPSATEVLSGNALYYLAGISMASGGGITFADGTYQDTAASGSGGATGAAGTSVGYTAGNTAPSGSATGDFWYENDTALYYANVWDGSTLGWLQISGIDGTDGATGATGPAGSDGGGGVSAGAGLTLNGSTLGIDPTAVVHVAGISSDGGATFDGAVYGTRFYGINNTTTGMNVDSGNYNLYLNSNGTVAQLVPGGFYIYATLSVDDLLTAKSGITLGSGITFADGTHQTTAASASTVTASYSGHLESAIVKTYYLDPRLPVERTVTEFYAICATGGCSAGIAGQNGTISSINVSPTGVTGSLANTTLPVGGTLDMTLSNVSNCFDLRFAVRYTQ